MIMRVLHNLAWIVALSALLLLSLGYLTGCHSAQYHFDKFVKKGGVVHCDTVTVNRVDTLIINGDTVLVNRPVTVVEKQIEYRTRWQTRYDYKIKHDSIEVIKYVTKWKTKEVVKIKKVEKRQLWLLWFMGGALSLYAVQRIYKRLF